MNREERLTYIANAIHAANKINNTWQNWEHKHRSDDTEIIPQAELVKEALRIIVDYCPENHKKRLGATMHQTKSYIDAVTKLRKFMITSNSRNGRIDRRESFVNIINILHPLVDTRHRYIIEKIMKLYEVLHS